MTIQQIKAYLKSNKITYDELSERSGIPIGTLKHIFSGVTKNPRIDTVQSIERALGLADAPPNKSSDDMYNEAEKRLINAYRQLVPAMKDYVLEMVEKLIESQPAALKTAKKA